MSSDRILHQTLWSLRNLCGIQEKGRKRNKENSRSRDPMDATELREFCHNCRHWFSVRRDYLLSRTLIGQRALSPEHDFTSQIEAIWHHLVRIAGTAPYPPLENGPYTRSKAIAAIDRVVNWCDDPAHRLLAAAKPGKHTGPGMTRKEANDKAIALAKADRFFVQRSLREWADAIGCSEGLVPKLDLWQQTMKRTGRGKKCKAHAPNVVPLTAKIEAVSADREPGCTVADQVIANEDVARAKSRWEASSPNRPWEALSQDEQRREIAALAAGDEELQRLVAEQEADQKADEGRKFRPRKRL